MSKLVQCQQARGQTAPQAQKPECLPRRLLFRKTAQPCRACRDFDRLQHIVCGKRYVRYQSRCRQVQLRDQSCISELGQEAMLLRADGMDRNNFTHFNTRITLTLVPEIQAPSGRGAR